MKGKYSEASNKFGANSNGMFLVSVVGLKEEISSQVDFANEAQYLAP